MQFDIHTTTSASRERVWRLLIDARSWPTWSAVDELVVARSRELGIDGTDAVGTVRAFRTGHTVTGERIVVAEPPRLLVYQDAFNPVLRNYRAQIELTETRSGGTAIRWSGRYDSLWWARAVMWWYLPHFMKRMAAGLVAHTS